MGKSNKKAPAHKPFCRVLKVSFPFCETVQSPRPMVKLAKIQPHALNGRYSPWPPGLCMNKCIPTSQYKAETIANSFLEVIFSVKIQGWPGQYVTQRVCTPQNQVLLTRRVSPRLYVGQVMRSDTGLYLRRKTTPDC